MAKFRMAFGILRCKAGKHMFQAGGGFPDLYFCFFCIWAAQLKLAEATLLMASTAGNVEFTRASKQLRQLFQAPNAATKEDISHVAEAPASTQDDDLSYEARLAFRKGNKQRTGAKNAPRFLSKSAGKKFRPKKGEQEKNGFNRRTGGRNRRYRSGSEYHLLPKYPTRQES